MTEKELMLYRKCVKKVKHKKRMDKKTYDDIHEYNCDINDDKEYDNN